MILAGLPLAMTAIEGAEWAPRVGALVVDVRRNRIGEVMASAGGREWEAFSCDVRPATAGDELRAKVTEVNDRSRRERGLV